jgi:hypothetical protein
VFGFTQTQTDGGVGRIRFNVRKELAQPLKGVGLKKLEKWIHGGRLSSLSGNAINKVDKPALSTKRNFIELDQFVI